MRNTQIAYFGCNVCVSLLRGGFGLLGGNLAQHEMERVEAWHQRAPWPEERSHGEERGISQGGTESNVSRLEAQHFENADGEDAPWPC